MNIEEELFNKYEIDKEKLIKYGFKKEKNKLVFKENIIDNKFIIIIEYDKQIKGKIIELEYNDEYTNFRMETLGEFNTNIKHKFIDLLTDIRDKCTIKKLFKLPQTNRINEFINKKYEIDPEFLWEKLPGYAVYRKNKKWFAIVGNVKLNKVNKNSKSTEEIEIINVKVPEDELSKFLNIKGCYEAFHMNKNNWISIILDDTLSDNIIENMLTNSYNIINKPEEWLVPANPKYYDVINCFNNTNEIIWKQSTNINIGDIVYLYVADPYSKIYYKCQVIEVNIPYNYEDKNVKMNHVMKLRLLKKLDNKNYNFSYLKSLGIKSIRGPRKINKEISNKIT